MVLHTLIKEGITCSDALFTVLKKNLTLRKMQINLWGALKSPQHAVIEKKYTSESVIGNFPSESVIGTFLRCTHKSYMRW